jgi:hypothetical protein
MNRQAQEIKFGGVYSMWFSLPLFTAPEFDNLLINPLHRQHTLDFRRILTCLWC